MKQIIAGIGITICAFVIAGLLGCASSRQGPDAPKATETNAPAPPRETAGNLLEVASFGAVSKHLVDDPEDRTKIEGIAARLGSVVTTNLFDDLLAQVMQLGDDDTKLVFASALLLYELELRRLAPIQQPAFVGRTADRVRAGIERALRAVPPKKAEWRPRYHWSWFHRHA